MDGTVSTEHDLVSAATAAKRLGMARSSVYRLAAKGTIPSYVAGPQLTGKRFDVSEVRAVLRRLAMRRRTNEEPKDEAPRRLRI